LLLLALMKDVDEDDDDDVEEMEDGDDVEPSDLTMLLGTSHLSFKF
jgi:hypothetical protein